jgi:hypothetical protein
MALEVEDAIQYVIRYLREDRKSQYGSYGYQIYIQNVARDYLIDAGVPQHEVEGQLHTRRDELAGAFFAAGWELSRRGILRPGIRTFGVQSTPDGASGHGYSLTPYGQRWLADNEAPDVPLDAGRLARMLGEAGARCGSGFLERADQAVKSYFGLAYLACCAMCGAAAESVLLALATAKSDDADKTLKTYSTGGGRGRIETELLRGQPEPVQREFHTATSICSSIGGTARLMAGR